MHGGVVEHGLLLFLRPDLVAPDVGQAPSWTAEDFPALRRRGPAPESVDTELRQEWSWPRAPITRPC